MISGAAEIVIRELSVDENEGKICSFFKVCRLYVKYHFVQDGGMFLSDHRPSG